MQKQIKSAICLVLTVTMLGLFAACGKKTDFEQNENGPLTEVSTEETTANQIHVLDKQVQEHTYRNSNHLGSKISIGYPELEQQGYEEINTQIRDFVAEIPEKLYGVSYENLQMELTYEVKRYDNQFFSVIYKGSANVKDAAHPDQIFVSQTFSLSSKKMISLEKFLKPSESLAKMVFENAPKCLEPAQAEAFRKTYKTEQDVINALKTCDSFSSENPFGTWSYLTEKNVGLIFPVPYEVGGYLTVEVPVEVSVQKKSAESK